MDRTLIRELAEGRFSRPEPDDDNEKMGAEHVAAAQASVTASKAVTAAVVALQSLQELLPGVEPANDRDRKTLEEMDRRIDSLVNDMRPFEGKALTQLIGRAIDELQRQDYEER